MAGFPAQNQDFETDVRESFGNIALMSTLGAALVRVFPGEVEIALPFRAELTQHHGFMAAAVLTAIADVACGYAAMSLMPAGASVLTVEYKVNFLAPAQGERMVARARVVRPGRTVTACASDVFAVIGGQERLVATMLATLVQAGGERTASPAEGKDRTCHPAHEHGTNRPLRKARPWCVCRGRGLRARLREMTGFAR